MKRYSCTPRNYSVNLREELKLTNVVFFPRCLLVQRCGGNCGCGTSSWKSCTCMSGKTVKKYHEVFWLFLLYCCILHFFRVIYCSCGSSRLFSELCVSLILIIMVYWSCYIMLCYHYQYHHYAISCYIIIIMLYYYMLILTIMLDLQWKNQWAKITECSEVSQAKMLPQNHAHNLRETRVVKWMLPVVTTLPEVKDLLRLPGRWSLGLDNGKAFVVHVYVHVSCPRPC